MLFLFIALPLFVALARAQGPVQTLFPAAVPLTVRSPYLSAWQNTTIGSPVLGSSWPQLWTESVSIFVQPGVGRVLKGASAVGNLGMAGDR